MTRISRPAKALWQSLVCALGLCLFAAGAASSQTIREFESSIGVVKLTVLPVAELPPPQEDDGSAGSDANPAIPPQPVAPALDSISDFTSLAELVREGEAEMEVYYLERGSSEELRFPLRYSELRRYLLLRPIAYGQPTAAERNVALFADLAGSLRVKMVEPADLKEKP